MEIKTGKKRELRQHKTEDIITEENAWKERRGRQRERK